MPDHYLKQELYDLIRQDARSFDFLQEATLDGIWFWDIENPDHEWMSDDFWIMLGQDPTKKAPLASEWQSLIDPEDLKAVHTELERHFADPSHPFDQIVRYTHRDGSTLWIRCRGMAIRDGQGRPVRMLGAHTDLTPVKRAQAELESRTRDLARIARAMDSAQEGIIITDSQATILSVNRAFTQITGYASSDVLGRNPRLLQSGRQTPDFYQAMWRDILQTGIWQGEIWNRRKNGEHYPQWTTISQVPGEAGEIDYVAVFSDLTEKKRAEDRIAFLAHYDPLTGLANRHLLIEHLHRSLDYCQREGLQLAVVTLDLDAFVQVNQLIGHEAGDRILIKVAERLKSCLRKGDTVARLGGDEFVVVAQLRPEPGEALLITQKLQSSLSQVQEAGLQDLRLTASLGVVLSSPGDDADTVLRHSHQAMCMAKQKGRGASSVFDASQTHAAEALRAERQGILEGIAKGEFTLFYQPKVDLRSGRVRGAEALIRWCHPERGLLLPGAFLPQTAGTDLEFQLGEWVVTEALQQMNAWKVLGRSIPVSINVSATHLLQPGFAERLESKFQAYPRLAPGDLEIEILESAAVEDWQRAGQAMRDCRTLGVRFALDDFGTGYSSLVHLRRLALDTLKLDKSFVGSMLQNPEDFSIVESVVSLAISFQLDAIAEGVETENQARVLRRMGCPIVQGFGIAKPMEASRIIAWAQEWEQFGLWKEL